MSYSSHIDNVMAEIVNDEELITSLVMEIINDPDFHECVNVAVIGSTGNRFVHLCERKAYKMAISLDQKRRNI